MIHRTVCIFLSVLILSLAGVVSCRKERAVPEEANPSPAFLTKKPYASYDFDLVSKIKDAKALLEEEEAGYRVGSRKVWGWVKKRIGKKVFRVRKTWTVEQLKSYNVLLAAFHIKSQKFSVVKVKPDGLSEPAGFDIDRGPRTGVSTHYEVEHPPGYVVLAIRRVVRLGVEFEEVIYVPFNKGLDTPELRRDGLSYLQTILQKARRELTGLGIRSRAFAERQVGDAVAVEVALALSIIEHIDPNRFLKDNIWDLVNKVLVTVAANREDAYRYAVSPAGARGLFQFIPNTYDRVRQQYPIAGLRSNFVAGMNDHLNAAKASLLLFDADLAFAPVDHRKFLAQHPDAMGQYLASAYNGGVGRTKDAIDRHGWDWPRHVLPETQVYIRKYLAVNRLFQD